MHTHSLSSQSQLVFYNCRISFASHACPPLGPDSPPAVHTPTLDLRELADVDEGAPDGFDEDNDWSVGMN